MQNGPVVEEGWRKKEGRRKEEGRKKNAGGITKEE
jgi:hypothetical protein